MRGPPLARIPRMNRIHLRIASGAFPTAVTVVMSLLLATLAVGAFFVARVAAHDQLTALGLQGAVLLANELRTRRPLGPGMLHRVIESFEAEGIASVALVNPERRVVASSEPGVERDLGADPSLHEAFRTGEVQVGWVGSGEYKAFRVHVPVDRIPGPRWRHRLHEPLPPGNPSDPPLPSGLENGTLPPGWGIEPGRVVLVLDVEPRRASWLWRWAFVHTVVSAAAVVLLWVAWFGARRSARAIAALEAERRRRETLARLGEMSAVLAHEVRNPLASLKGHLQLAVEEMGRGSGALVPQRISQALDDTSRIEALVRGLLDYAREATPSSEDLPAEALLALARDMAGPWPDGLNLEMVVTPGTVFHADRDQMGRAIANLMRNAREAAGSTGRVRVTARVADSVQHVTVEDSGPGIPKDLVARVFEPFVTGKVRGVGLGLAVARKLVEAHGGRIVMGRSADLGGARFDVEWPYRASGG